MTAMAEIPVPDLAVPYAAPKAVGRQNKEKKCQSTLSNAIYDASRVGRHAHLFGSRSEGQDIVGIHDCATLRFIKQWHAHRRFPYTFSNGYATTQHLCFYARRRDRGNLISEQNVTLLHSHSMCSCTLMKIYPHSKSTNLRTPWRMPRPTSRRTARSTGTYQSRGRCKRQPWCMSLREKRNKERKTARTEPFQGTGRHTSDGEVGQQSSESEVRSEKASCFFLSAATLVPCGFSHFHFWGSGGVPQRERRQKLITGEKNILFSISLKK